LWGGGGDDSEEDVGAGQQAYDNIMQKFTEEEKQLYGPMIQRVAYEAQRKAVESSMSPEKRKLLGLAPGGKNVESGSTPERPYALGGEYLSGQTGLTDQQMSQAIARANQRRGAGRAYRQHLRQLGMSGIDIESLTPEQMQAAGLSAENIAMVQGAQKYRSQQRALAGGRSFSQWGSGFSGAPRPTTPAPSPQPAMPSTATSTPSPVSSPTTTTTASSAQPPRTLLSGAGSFVQQQGQSAGTFGPGKLGTVPELGMGTGGARFSSEMATLRPNRQAS